MTMNVDGCKALVSCGGQEAVSFMDNTARLHFSHLLLFLYDVAEVSSVVSEWVY